MIMPAAAGAYAEVDGLRIYYEAQGRGDGPPLLLLHGGMMTLEEWGPILPALAARRRVLALELEGHGRTTDLERPLTLAQMARDVSGFIDAAAGGPVDLMGYSMGAMVALGAAIARPDRVRRLVLVAGARRREDFYPRILAQWPAMTAAALAGTPMEAAYRKVAPHPDRWPGFVDKMREAMVGFEGYDDDALRGLKSPALVAVGDCDLVPPEAAMALLRLLGGGPEDGGLGARPASRLAVLPGTTHFDILFKTELLRPMVEAFLDG